MSRLRQILDSERWQWFAAGDPDLAPIPRSTSTGNEPDRLLFQVGLVFAVPLALAALIQLVFGG